MNPSEYFALAGVILMLFGAGLLFVIKLIEARGRVEGSLVPIVVVDVHELHQRIPWRSRHAVDRCRPCPKCNACIGGVILP